MEKKDRQFVYAQTATGATVRIPADRYDSWKKEQDRLAAGGEPSPETREMAKRLASYMMGK